MSLQARDLALAKGDRFLFSALSFTVEPGTALRVTGPNGSGKTSLLRVLCGLTRPDDGEVSWQGTPIGVLGAQYGASLAYAGHADALKGDLLAWENVAFGAFLDGKRRKEQALHCLSSLGLRAQAELPCRALSQGQRKRVALARALLAAPRALWILDEPFNALDAQASATLSDLLDEHCAAGGALVYTTHQQQGPRLSARLDLGAGASAPC